jgi:hypothetical protein
MLSFCHLLLVIETADANAGIMAARPAITVLSVGALSGSILLREILSSSVIWHDI